MLLGVRDRCLAYDVAARRGDLAWADGLEGVHLRIAAWDGPRLRVVAGPGTGKTFAVMRRIARLLESGTEGKQVLAVTFTRTAARDLVDKLAQLGVPGADDVRASTLHSLCFSILSRAAVFEITGRVPRPLLAHEQRALTCDLQDGFGGKKRVTGLLLAFEAAWATLQSQQPGWPQDTEQRAFHRALLKWLRFHGAILIGELVPLTLDFLRDNPLSSEAPRYDFVLTDEFQDLNRADQELIELLGQVGSQTVVGDEDQSIYSFRYAHPEGITEYSERYPNTHDETVVECRRCPVTIVEMASSLIANNTRQRAELPTSMPGNSAGRVSVLQHASLQDEVESISQYVSVVLSGNGQIAPSDILILANRRKIGYAIRNEVNRIASGLGATWSAQSFFTEQALDGDGAQRGFTLLTLLVSPDDRPAYRAWLGIGHPDFYHKQYGKLWALAEDLAISPRAAARAVLRGEYRLPHCTQILARARELEALTARLPVDDIPALVSQLFREDDEAGTDIRQMAASLADSVQSPTELLDELRSLITQPELPPDPSDIVRIMSLHKSKGLTAKVVVVVGCLEGVIPFVPRGLDELEAIRVLDEQRRLFYVAITRSSDTLVLSSSNRMALADAMSMNVQFVPPPRNVVQCRASRFLGELGPSRPRVRTDVAAWLDEQR